jgi:sortase A
VRIVRWIQFLLFAAAISAIGWCAFVITDTWIFQNREEHLLIAHRETSAPLPVTLVSGGLIGRIEIARVGVSAIFMEGDDMHTLRRAVGHIPGTALPGRPGNVGIAGHRDTFFRPLRNVKRDDVITLTTILGEYRYRVVSTKIVGPNDVDVLDPGPNEILTLVTCYPFYYLGSAPDRFIVRAERIA